MRNGRKFRRAAAGTLALRVGRGVRHAYSVENVSANGALLAGSEIPVLGEVLRLVLHVKGLTPVTLDAEVIRIEEGSAERVAFAVIFRELSNDLRDAIQQAVMSHLRRQSAERWLSADGRPDSEASHDAQPLSSTKRK